MKIRFNAFAPLLIFLLCGCVTRSLTIKTTPPGATVYLNDNLKGHSPISFDPMWYGTYKVTIRKEGFKRTEEIRELKAPGYLWVPFDLISEALPIKKKDERVWEFTLEPEEEIQAPAPPELEK